MKKIEAKLTTKLIHWLKSDKCDLKTCAIEVKVMRGNRFYFSALKEHQKNALLLAKNNKIVYKIPDTGYQNPFDIVFMKKVNAYVVVIKDKEAYFMDIGIVDKCWQKSLTLIEIQKLSEFSVGLI